MTPNALAVALFAAFVVGGVVAEVVPLWLVVLLGLAVGAAALMVINRYPRGGGRRPTEQP
jgi:hypothetical protein